MKCNLKNTLISNALEIWNAIIQKGNTKNGVYVPKNIKTWQMLKKVAIYLLVTLHSPTLNGAHSPQNGLEDLCLGWIFLCLLLPKVEVE